MKQIQAIRGMNDILPEQTPCWQFLENTVRHVLASYSYDEIRLPIVEKTDLFARSIGEVTDIVEKEMYTFADRNGDSLTLRPEGTASCVRACIQNGLLREQRKLWYIGPMFRHERPQKGRYRQFHQIGVEVYGIDGPDIDAELILMTARFWQLLGLNDLTLELNSLGSAPAREQYRRVLVSYFESNMDELDEDSVRRLGSNPLRILDSKNKDMQALIEAAPKLIDHLDDESREHFNELCVFLDDAGIDYRLNTRLVRGLDYYGRTVFEWTTDKLGAQATVCAGGRYDALVEQLGGKPVQAVGFAMGLERLISLICEDDNQHQEASHPHAFLVLAGDDANRKGLTMAEKLRNELPDLRLKVNAGGGSFKSQFKRANRSGARYALILGDEEVADGTLGIKYLREEKQQQTLDLNSMIAELKHLIEI